MLLFCCKLENLEMTLREEAWLPCLPASKLSDGGARPLPASSIRIPPRGGRPALAAGKKGEVKCFESLLLRPPWPPFSSPADAPVSLPSVPTRRPRPWWHPRRRRCSPPRWRQEAWTPSLQRRQSTLSARLRLATSALRLRKPRSRPALRSCNISAKPR